MSMPEVDHLVGADLARGAADHPRVQPDATSLEWLELLLIGALPPLAGPMTSEQAKQVISTRHLPDGAAWPVPVRLPIPEDVAASQPTFLTVEDPEGRPFALLGVQTIWRDPTHPDQPNAAGALSCLDLPVFGPLREHRRTPAQVRPTLPPGQEVLAVPVTGPLQQADLEALRTLAPPGAAVLLLPMISSTWPGVVAAHHLHRLAHAAAAALPLAQVVPLALPWVPEPLPRIVLLAHVATAFGATQLLLSDPDSAELITNRGQLAGTQPGELPLPIGHLHHVPSATARLPQAELHEYLDDGKPFPAQQFCPEVAAILAQAYPAKTQRGVCVLLTGLSGSGKSTIARGLAHAVTDAGRAQVSLLDGDLVRSLLSAGLGFSRQDRELNVARIGFVAAEITRHGGLAIAAPIAPYASSRATARHLVQQAGGAFVLVHVATPLAECERRDVKGLYARARSGHITHFTGISDPYEQPEDADLTIDTLTQTPAESVARIVAYLRVRGWLPPTRTGEPG